MQKGDAMFIYLRRNKRVLQDQFGSKPTDRHKVQLQSNFIEGEIKLGGIEFVQVKAMIKPATTHLDVCSGSTSLGQLKNKFRTCQGYSVVNLCGTDLNLNFSWKGVLDLSNGVYFFEPPLPNSRYHSYLFSASRIIFIAYTNTIFGEPTQETVGDALASCALYHTYPKDIFFRVKGVVL